MKKSTVICLLTSLVALTAASASVSVAWYATASRLAVEDINVTLSGSSELLISTKNEKGTFKSELNYEDLQQVEAFEPVSGLFRDEWFLKGEKNPKFYECPNSRSTIIIHSETNTYAEPTHFLAKKGFYSQELFLYSESNYYALLDLENTIIEPNSLANWSRAEKLAEEAKAKGRTKTAEEYYKELNNLVNSIRFSVLVDSPDKYDYKLFDPIKNQSSTKLGGLVDSSGDGYFDTAGINENKCETIYGEVNDRNLIKYLDSPQQEIIIENSSWHHANHDREAMQIDFASSYQNGLEIELENAMSLEEYKTLREKVVSRKASQEEKDALLLIPLSTGVATRIVLSIYFEGFDLDNTNETMSGSFTSKIGFDVVDKNII